MKQTKKFHLTGVAPLLMHNGALSDPLYEYSKLIRKITDKRKKTEADLEELSRLEWFGGLYLHNGEPCLPMKCLKATLLRAATTLKKGPKIKSGLVIEEHAALLYDGPRDPQKLWEDKRFIYRTTKAQNKVRIVRTRALFFPWEADILIAYNDETLSPDEVDEIVTIGGHSIGLLDERPEYGRYVAEEH